MKKIIYSVLIIVLFISCDSDKTKELTDLNYENLKGDVVFLEEVNGDYFDSKIFNLNGMIIREFRSKNELNYGYTNYVDNYLNNKIINTSKNEVWYDGNNQKSLTTNTIYNYNDKGLLISSERSFDSDITTKKYEYNENGLLIKTTRRRKNDPIYPILTHEYYYSNKSLDSITLSDGFSFEKFYYKNGFKIKQEYYPWDSKNKKTNIYYQKNYEYGNKPSTLFLKKDNDRFNYFDNKNPISEKRTYYPKDGSRKIVSVETVKCIYDTHDNIIEEKIIMDVKDGSGERKFIKTYEYIYDPQGNWIEKKVIKGEDIKTHKRTIIYKGGDYSDYINKYDNVMSRRVSNNETPSLNSNSGNERNLNNTQQSQPSYDNQSSRKQNKNKCYQCNGTGKCKSCNKIFTLSYYDYNSHGWKSRNETKPGYVMHSQCFGRGYYKGGEDMQNNPKPKEECNCMDGWVFCSECNSSGHSEYIGLCSYCKGSG